MKDEFLLRGKSVHSGIGSVEVPVRISMGRTLHSGHHFLLHCSLQCQNQIQLQCSFEHGYGEISCGLSAFAV